jgi:hypothetical protein
MCLLQSCRTGFLANAIAAVLSILMVGTRTPT